MLNVRAMIKAPLWLRALVVILLVAMVVLLVYPERLDLSGTDSAARVKDLLVAYGGWAPAAFIVLHILLSIMFIPRLVMGIAAGLTFGFWGGMLWSMSGAMAGALVGFVLARYVRGDSVVVEDIPKLGPLLQRAEAGGWRSVMVARFVPLIPHPVLNYALGLTRVGTGEYLVGTFFGLLPSAIAYTEFGASSRDALTGRPDWMLPLLGSVVLLLASFALPKLAKRWIGP